MRIDFDDDRAGDTLLTPSEFRFLASSLRNSFYDLHSSGRFHRWWMVQVLVAEDLCDDGTRQIAEKVEAMSGDQMMRLVRDINRDYAKGGRSEMAATVAERLLTYSEFTTLCRALRDTLFNFSDPDPEHVAEEIADGVAARLAHPFDFGVDYSQVIRKVHAMDRDDLALLLARVDRHYAAELDRA